MTQPNEPEKTRILVHFDAGFPNKIYVRGEGPDLSWEQGVALKNIKPDIWIWESETSFSSGEFKVLINDKVFEIGDNHPLLYGSSIRIKPKFPAQ